MFSVHFESKKTAMKTKVILEVDMKILRGQPNDNIILS